MFWNIDKQFEKLGYKKRLDNDIDHATYVQKTNSRITDDVIDIFYDDEDECFIVSPYRVHTNLPAIVSTKLLTYKELKLCVNKIKQLQREMKKVNKNE